MIKFILVAVTVIGFLLFGAGLLWQQRTLAKEDIDRMHRESLDIVRKVFRFILRVSGVKVQVKGLENIPKDQAVLYVGNHRSYFDILVAYTTVPSLVGFVAKKEMRRYPLLSDWMVNVNCLFLDRSSPKEGLKMILEGIQKIKDGISVWIFPEGTRNRSDDILELLPFKEGSLKMAEKSGCPVIPVAISGTAEVFENHLPRICRANVVIEFGTPFYTRDLEPETKKRVGAYTRDIIVEMLKKEI